MAAETHEQKVEKIRKAIIEAYPLEVSIRMIEGLNADEEAIKSTLVPGGDMQGNQFKTSNLVSFFKFWENSTTISAEQLQEIRDYIYTEESFKKFDDPNHPQYSDYKDRENEKWHDKGSNNAIDFILRIITGKRYINGKEI